MSFQPGDVVRVPPLRPASKRPHWLLCLLVLPWLRWRAALEQWKHESLRYVTRVLSSTTLEVRPVTPAEAKAQVEQAPTLPTNTVETSLNSFALKPKPRAPTVREMLLRMQPRPRIVSRPGQRTRWSH